MSSPTPSSRIASGGTDGTMLPDDVLLVERTVRLWSATSRGSSSLQRGSFLATSVADVAWVELGAALMGRGRGLGGAATTTSATTRAAGHCDVWLMLGDSLV